MKQNTELKLLTVPQMAEALQVSERTIHSWTKKRKISVLRISERCLRYHLPTVLADLAQLQIPARGRGVRS